MFSKNNLIKCIASTLPFLIGLFFITNNTFAYEASISTSGTINLNIMSAGTGAGVATDNINVVSTCPSGYTLSISATSSTNSLFNDTTLYKSGDNTDSNMITASSGTTESPATITGNNLGTWGYSTTSSTISGTFIGLTAEPVIITTKASPSATGGDNMPVYYGASAPTTLEPGLYQMSDNAVITYYLTTSPECARYTIAYDDNNADAGTMGIQTTDDNGDELADNSEVTLSPSNFSRAGYGFAGWSLVELNPDSASFSTDLQAAITAGQVFGPQETITLDSAITSEADSGGVITMYAIWIKAEIGVTLQTWNGCSAMTATTYTGDATDQNIWSITASANSLVALKDERDNETYAIAKLSDGNCWMIENLRLADKDHNNNDVILSSANTNNPSLPLTNIYDTSSTSNHLSPTSSIAYDASTAPEGWCTTNSAACFDQSRLRTDNTTNRVSYTATQTMSADANFYSYGNYYNWYSATAGNGKYSTGSNVIVSGDICPAGWHLPYGNNGSDTSGGNTSGGFYYLANSMSATTSDAINSKKHRHFPNNYLYSGLINGASPGNLGSYGNYWSTTVYNNNSAYNLRISSSSIDPGTGYNYKHYGRSIRCVASAGYTVSFNANGGTGAMSDQSIPVGVATNLTSNSFTRTGYEFAGWNTAADGFGTSYTDAQSVTNLALPGRTITLYAQWQKNYMQNMTSAKIAELIPNTHDTAILYDIRDDQAYTVAKLADNKYWMVENLNLAGGTLLSSNDTNFASNYTLPTTNGWTVSNGKLRLPTSSTSGFSNNNYAYVYNSGNKTNCGDVNQNTPCYSYYSWDVATLGSGRSLSTDNADAPYSVCPKNWRLPKSRTTSANNWQTISDLYVLAHHYGLDSTSSTTESDSDFYNRAGPNTIPKFLLNGFYASGSFQYGGFGGGYWSSTSSDSTNARSLGLSASHVSAASSDNRSFGASVRCLFGS